MTTKPRKNIMPNIKLPEAVIRLGAGLALPVLLVWFRTLPFIILISVASTYLLVTGMLFFCFIKYIIQHTLPGKKTPTYEEEHNPIKEL